LELKGGRLAFFVGDVSGKGMPAALYMVAVHALGRHLAATGDGPTETLTRLNGALAADNPSGMFVTLAHGHCNRRTGDIVLASGGHPLPLIRRADGTVEPLQHKTGRLLGYDAGDLHLSDASLTLAPGDMLVFYTDGYTEAREPTKRMMFGLDRLREVVAGFQAEMPLAVCAARAKTAIDQFTASSDLQDDLTLLLMRRRRQAAV
jgi:sigma-B regulation protein RsbU (phosphoserine phosphatase)